MDIHQTAASVITIVGEVDATTEAVEVNGFRLRKFEPGNTTFSYIANAAYGNMKEGENTYTIRAFGPKGVMSETSIKVHYAPVELR